MENQKYEEIINELIKENIDEEKIRVIFKRMYFRKLKNGEYKKFKTEKIFKEFLDDDMYYNCQIMAKNNVNFQKIINKPLGKNYILEEIDDDKTKILIRYFN